jgi:hypothetical protein
MALAGEMKIENNAGSLQNGVIELINLKAIN